MKMLGNKVHLRPLPKAERSAGGILLPTAYNDDQMQYEVLAAGPGRKLKNGRLIPCPVCAGQRVLAPLYFDHVILDDGTRVADADQLIAAWETSTE